MAAPDRVIGTAKLATFITPTQLAFTLGDLAEVKVGDKVILHRPVEIVDPDTKDALGTVLLVKLRLTVTVVAAKYFVANVADPKSNGRGIKNVTTDFLDEERDVVLVKVGEEAQLARPVVDDPWPDEPPF